MSKSTVIDIKGLNKVFGKGHQENHVLKDINLKIYSGEFVVIFGPSGCGKTTLLNCMIGLEPPTKGKVIVRGTSITDLKDNERATFRTKKFGMVFQLAYWIKSLTVKENVSLPLTIVGISEESAISQAEKMLERAGVGDHGDKLPSELSGGEQQRVGLARALIGWPWIVIADEPTGNLDVENGKKIMDLLKKLSQKKKRTVILVTHNVDYL